MKRDQDYILKEYEKVWAFKKLFSAHRRKVLLRGRPATQSILEDRRMLLKEFSEIIASMNPKLVLEAGCGNGAMTLALSILHPEVCFEGLELTDAGVKAANNFLDNPSEQSEQLRWLTGVEGKPKAKFTQGNMLNLPYKDNSFDCVFTSMSIEQLPRDFPRAFQEIHRVTRKYAFFYEGFHEFNSLRQLVRRWKSDIFRGSINEVVKAGFNIIAWRESPIDKIIYHDGFLIVKKLKKLK